MWHKDTFSVYPVTTYSSEGFYNPSRVGGYNDSEAFYSNRFMNPIMDVWNFENEWSNGICACEKIGTCCCAHFCFPCYLFKLFKRTGEFICTPLFSPNSLMALRAKVRTGFRIRGTLTDDFFKTTFLPCCSAVQLANELDMQGL